MQSERFGILSSQGEKSPLCCRERMERWREVCESLFAVETVVKLGADLPEMPVKIAAMIVECLIAFQTGPQPAVYLVSVVALQKFHVEIVLQSDEVKTRRCHMRLHNEELVGCEGDCESGGEVFLPW